MAVFYFETILNEFEKILLKTRDEEINYFNENKKYKNLKLEVVEEDDINLGYTYDLYYNDILIYQRLVKIDIASINKYASFIAAIKEYMSKNFKLNIIESQIFRGKFENTIKLLLDKDNVLPFMYDILIKNKEYDVENIKSIYDFISKDCVNELIMDNYEYD